MAKTKKPTDETDPDFHLQEVMDENNTLKEEKTRLLSLIRDNLEQLFRHRYVLRTIPGKQLLAEDANRLYEKFRDVLGDEGQELDKKYRGL